MPGRAGCRVYNRRPMSDPERPEAPRRGPAPGSRSRRSIGRRDVERFDVEDGHRRARVATVHPGHPPRRLPRPAVDDAPVRRLRLGGGDESALPVPPRTGPDRPVRRVRPADPDGLRLRRPAGGRRGGPRRACRSTRSTTWSSCSTASTRARSSTSMTINATAAILLALYETVARRRGVDPRSLRGTIQNDILKEYIARGTYIFPPAPSMRLVTDTFAYCRAELPSWNTISISGYHMREAGATAVQEVAFTVANAIAYADAARGGRARVRRLRPAALASSSPPTTTSSRRSRSSAPRGGSGPPWHASASAPWIPGAWPCASTSRPAARRSPRSSPTSTSCAPPSRRLAAVARRRPVAPHQRARRGARAAHAVDRRGWRCARNKCCITSPAWPRPSTRWVARSTSRHLTDEIATAAMAEITAIDALGGTLAALADGYQQNAIGDAAYDVQRAIESGERIVVGVNAFTDEGTEQRPEPQVIDPGLEAEQVERTRAVRDRRDAATADERRGGADRRRRRNGERAASHPRLRRGRCHARRDRARAAGRVGRASAMSDRTDPSCRDRGALDRRGAAALPRALRPRARGAADRPSRRSASASASCRPARSQQRGSSCRADRRRAAAWRATSPPHGEGVHHVCFLTDDLPGVARGARRPRRPSSSTREPRPGAHGTVAFIHPRTLNGVLWELLQQLGVRVRRIDQFSIGSPSAPKTHQTSPTPWPLMSPAAASPAKR